jgi:lipoprotein-anchoring transpeptidase ErfK/SrfK
MTSLSRRDFLKLGALGAGALASVPLPFDPARTQFDDTKLVRVASGSISVHVQPDDKGRIVATWPRDTLLNVYKEVNSGTPKYNPVWYRVWGGYVHRTHLQKVSLNYNKPATSIRKEGQLAEVTVPYSDAVRIDKQGQLSPGYRMYFESVHWVVDVETGPDGEPWYKILDELTEVYYHASAMHLRLIPDAELDPISPEVPFEQKRLDVDLTMQTVTAYEYNQAVFTATVSTGLAALQGANAAIPTVTPQGDFNVMVKMPSKHMGGGNLAGDLDAYALPGVPWCTFFTEVGHAFHGAYWHDNYGTPMSHGCINMRPDEAKWIFRWTRPLAAAKDIDPLTLDRKGLGTAINIHY